MTFFGILADLLVTLLTLQTEFKVDGMVEFETENIDLFRSHTDMTNRTSLFYRITCCDQAWRVELMAAAHIPQRLLYRLERALQQLDRITDVVNPSTHAHHPEIMPGRFERPERVDVSIATAVSRYDLLGSVQDFKHALKASGYLLLPVTEHTVKLRSMAMNAGSLARDFHVPETLDLLVDQVTSVAPDPCHEHAARIRRHLLATDTHIKFLYLRMMVRVTRGTLDL
jgi:hypothetical protein